MTRPRVLAAMSGGVDSSVAAALLLEQGYDVIGVTMQVWPDLSPAEEVRRGGCCSITAVNDAQLVADALGIPYYVLDMQEVFERTVIDYFVREYARGRTPNPCIACNKFVKFEALLQKALELGCEYVATGHYARIDFDQDSGRYRLWRSADRRKDQTYALYDLRQEQLGRTLFPLGGLTKPEVRRLAEQFGLVTAHKPDSQEICFVLDDDYGAFIEERAPETVVPGPIYDLAGRRIGTHRGLPHYTVGQRRGLGISADEPLYVVEIRPEDNALVVGRADDVFAAGLIAEDLNWIPFATLDGPRRCTARIRYNAREAACTVFPLPAGDGGALEGPGGGVGRGGGARRAVVVFDDMQRAVTPGQAVVFYDGDLVLGGGTIDRALRADEAESLAARAGAVTVPGTV